MKTLAGILAFALAAACRKPAPPPAWPSDLTRDVTAVTVERRRGDEPVRATRMVKGADGIWRTASPRRGEADPDAVSRLFFTLAAPAVQASTRVGPAATQPPWAFRIGLARPGGGTSSITIFRAELGSPVNVLVHPDLLFTVAPTEFATKVPDPADLLPAGLWNSAQQAALSLEVRGPTSYRLHRAQSGEWVSDDGRPGGVDLDDVPGVITGRQAIDHPEGSASELGLDPPRAVATLCSGAVCRTFQFGQTVRQGATRCYAVGPDMDPLELRDDAWKLLVEGPFAGRGE